MGAAALLAGLGLMLAGDGAAEEREEEIAPELLQSAAAEGTSETAAAGGPGAASESGSRRLRIPPWATPMVTQHLEPPTHLDLSPKGEGPLETGGPSGDGTLTQPNFNGADDFGLAPNRCFRRFFPGAPPPLMRGHETIWEPESFHGDYGRNLLIPPPENAAFGNARACALMNLRRRGNIFLFRSELAMRNHRVGLVLWTGIRSTKGPRSDLSYLNIANHLVLLRKTPEGEWIVESGFSWRTESESDRPRMRSVVLRFPNGQIHKVPGSPAGSNTPEVTAGYAGMWKRRRGGRSPALTLSREYPYASEGAIDATLLSGYRNGPGIRSFYREWHRPRIPWSWKRILGEKHAIRLDVGDAIESWYDVFREERSGVQSLFGITTPPLMGEWIDMEKFCVGHGEIPEGLKRNDICHREQIHPLRPLLFPET